MGFAGLWPVILRHPQSTAHTYSGTVSVEACQATFGLIFQALVLFYLYPSSVADPKI